MDGKRVPSGWRLAKFSDVAEVNPRRLLRLGRIAAFVEMAALPEHSPRIAYVTERQANGGGARFQNGDTLFARITPCVENGKTGFVDFLAPGQVGFGSTEFIVLGPKDGSTDSKFIYFLARSDTVRSTAIARMTGTSGRQRVPLSVFQEELDVLLPPLPEQRRIAEILTTTDEAIERTEAVVQQVRVVKRGLMQQLLTRGLPGRHARFKQTEVGEIPTDWQVVKLGEVAKVQTGVAKNSLRRWSKPIKLPYLRVANVQDGFLDLREIKTIMVESDEAAHYELKRGDVLFTEGGDPDKLGRGAIWTAAIAPCLHQNHVFAVRPDTARLLPEFLATYAAGYQGKRYFLMAAKQTTNLASVNATQLRDFPIAIPSIEEQRGVLAALGIAEQYMEKERQALDEILGLKTALMQALLTGEIRVKVEE